jgi:glycosyltransferase involved in cell wall biosynthesis
VIAAARNGGGRAARGEIVAFVDADSQIHPRTFEAIESILASGRVIGGATGVRLERWSLGITLTYVLMLPLVWLTGMDTGVVFCRREDFDAVGGYDETRLYAEDVAFLLALRRLGKARGQHLGRVRSAKAVASTRKFDEFGDWHFLTLMPRLGVEMLRDPAAGPEFARRYWYRPKR